MTLFYFKYADGFLFSTEISLLYDAVQEKPHLNWAYLTSFVVNSHNITTVTPFENIHEVEPGCITQLSLNEKPAIEQFRDPTQIKSAYIENEIAFQEKIFHTLQDVTRAWVDKAEGICVELSGGLDSSSVLAVLKDVMPQDKPLTAINIFHPAIASSNETHFAKNAADSCKVPSNSGVR